jgi:hypothetical protein
MVGPPLTLVVCGAPLAARAGDVCDALSTRWTVSTVVTEAAGKWFAGRSDPDRVRPEAVVVCPLTFNTANKVAAGIMDTSAAGVLCEALGARLKIVAVPMVNNLLWGHPAWLSTLRTLVRGGIRFVDPQSGRVGDPEPVQSGTGPEVVAAFDPAWVVGALS